MSGVEADTWVDLKRRLQGLIGEAQQRDAIPFGNGDKPADVDIEAPSNGA